MNFDLLKRLCETPGIASREERMRALVIEELEPLTHTEHHSAPGLDQAGVSREHHQYAERDPAT